MTGPPLLDLHHLGQRQTGNESWVRSMAAALLERDGAGSYDIAVTSVAPAEDLAILPARETVTVSRSSAVRLAVDLPRTMRLLKTPAVLVQYTVPLSSVPAIVAVHDLSFEDPRASEWLPLAARLRYRATVRASVRRAGHILAISAYTRDDLVRHYDVDPTRITVVPAAVDSRFALALRTAPQDRGDPPTILVVGNVLPRKNLLVVARAVRLLRERRVDVVLRVVGTVHAAGRTDAEAVGELLGDAVDFTGYVTTEQLAVELGCADVLAFPSLFEGFGIPVLEAMVAGLPVVVADRTSLPEVVGGAGLVVPAEDVGAWADALEAALGPARDDLVAAGVAREREFSWATSAGLVGDVLATFADRTSREPR